MANYTMEIRQMIDNPLIGLFTFDYDFYSDNPKDKEDFEKLFAEWYYFTEIGFETPERFKLKLQAKLNVIMPYYRQLAQTEWDKVRTVEQMMTSKNLKETSTHEQTISGNNESSLNGKSSQTGSSTSTQKQTSTNNQIVKNSNLSDGVSQSSLEDGFLTSTTSSDGHTSQDITGNTSDTTGITSTQNSLGTNNQTLSESTTFTSEGDIGIQTPAYAITEWRKVLININQQIINECRDLFMSIY